MNRNATRSQPAASGSSGRRPSRTAPTTAAGTELSAAAIGDALAHAIVSVYERGALSPLVLGCLLEPFSGMPLMWRDLARHKSSDGTSVADIVERYAAQIQRHSSVAASVLHALRDGQQQGQTDHSDNEDLTSLLAARPDKARSTKGSATGARKNTRASAKTHSSVDGAITSFLRTPPKR